MKLLAPVAVLLCAGAAHASPPLAGVPARPEAQAADPVTFDDLPLVHFRRLRFATGLAFNHLQLRNPGGNALGIGGSVTLERRRDELAVSAWYFGGLPAQDAHGRNTGLGGPSLRAAYRVVPVPGELRVMLEAGVQGGYDRAFAFCVERECRFVPGRMSGGAFLGTVVQLRATRNFFTLGFDVIARGPNPPAPLYRAPIALQVWTETGFGGVAW
ncbi:MAG: hypothetical protein ACK4N5_16160 [Myxococcales bacterium]